MKLRTQLLVAPAVAAGMLVLSLAAFLWALHDTQLRNAALHDDAEAAFASSSQVQVQLADTLTRIYRTISIVASMSGPEVQQARDRLRTDLADATKRIQALGSSSVADTAIKEDAERLGAMVAAYAKAGDAAIDLATVDPNTGVAAAQTADAQYRKLLATLKDLIDRSHTRAQAAAEAGARRVSALMWLLAGLCFGAAVAGLAFAWHTQRRVVDDVARAASAARRIAQGHLDVALSTQRSDEIGMLLTALQDMVSGLNSSLLTVQQASQSIHTASTEIASGNSDLSSRTEQTASSLQQTASSMEQLSGTVRQTADSARTANDLASSTAQAAARGGDVVTQVVSSMSEIHTASRKINEIIGVIDGIAFQTNILALNAAVEAARAGEQGRGFAVVAGEVRSLAQRSAQAAREIKTLINASTERVEEGSKLVEDAGSAMSEIVAGVQRVRDIISEITAATAEQASGIGQVSQAVSHLDQMTQQNAALVEQSSAAAESLKDQAGTLSSVVSHFQLGEHHG